MRYTSRVNGTSNADCPFFINEYAERVNGKSTVYGTLTTVSLLRLWRESMNEIALFSLIELAIAVLIFIFEKD